MTVARPLHILVAEDEAMIGLMIEDFLGILGHRLVGLCTSVDACAALLDSSTRLDAAILDCNLTDGAVWPVARRMRDHGIPIIFASGGDGHGVPDDLSVMPTLEKPFSLAALERALASLAVT